MIGRAFLFCFTHERITEAAMAARVIRMIAFSGGRRPKYAARGVA